MTATLGRWDDYLERKKEITAKCFILKINKYPQISQKNNRPLTIHT
jgi:hypothetical protein